jgi:hypothetical protein
MPIFIIQSYFSFYGLEQFGQLCYPPITHFSTEPVLQITLFFTCSNMGALICNYLLDKASNESEFATMNRQDGHLQFYPKWNNLRSHAHGHLRLEQDKVAIA